MPTRLDFVLDASVAKLDTSPVNSGILTPGIEAINLSDDEVRRFNALAFSLNEAMPPLSADQLSGIARRVLLTAAAGGQTPFIKSRMRRAAEMRGMATDPAWPLAETPARRIRELLAYIDGSKGLIATGTPVLANLDDALLVDIAMDTMRDELDEYAEFCRYRRALAADLGIATAAVKLDRARWEYERDDELRLEHQLRRVHESTYSSSREEFSSSAADRVFHVL